jgi:hypothetical protein
MKPQSLAQRWQDAFLDTIRHREMGLALQQTALCGELGNWTKVLTTAVVSACGCLDWKASAKGHSIDLLPVNTQEFLALDVTAFEQAAKPYQFPIAVMELENQASRVPYSLWKVLCVRTQLRVVFGYSDTAEERAALIGTLRDRVLAVIEPGDRLAINGETIIAVGSRDDAESFPYGYFKWWRLEKNTGTFRVVV